MIPGRLAAPLLCLGLLPGCQALLTETTSTLAGIGSASIDSGVGADAAATTLERRTLQGPKPQIQRGDGALVVERRAAMQPLGTTAVSPPQCHC